MWKGTQHKVWSRQFLPHIFIGVTWQFVTTYVKGHSELLPDMTPTITVFLFATSFVSASTTNRSPHTIWRFFKKYLCWEDCSDCFLTEARSIFSNELEGESTALGSVSWWLDSAKNEVLQARIRDAVLKMLFSQHISISDSHVAGLSCSTGAFFPLAPFNNKTEISTYSKVAFIPPVSNMKSTKPRVMGGLTLWQKFNDVF